MLISCFVPAKHTKRTAHKKNQPFVRGQRARGQRDLAPGRVDDQGDGEGAGLGLHRCGAREGALGDGHRRRPGLVPDLSRQQKKKKTPRGASCLAMTDSVISLEKWRTFIDQI